MPGIYNHAGLFIGGHQLGQGALQVGHAHARQERLSFLLNERELLKIRYACDVHHLDTHNAERRQHWTRQFATNHDGTPKGIFTLIL